MTSSWCITGRRGGSTPLLAAAVLLAVGATVRLVERRKYQQRLRRMEQESALERERSRIAQDLHDELGSSLTRISLLSELVRADKDNPAQVELHAGKLSQSASQTVRALEEIVWAVRPGSDTLQSLVDYITPFCGRNLRGQPGPLPAGCAGRTAGAHPAAGRAPQHLFDRQGNADQHLEARRRHRGPFADQSAAATAWKSSSPTTAGDSTSTAAAAAGKRNGLDNMHRRAQAVGGSLTLTSSPGAGTRMEFSVGFPG